MAYDRLAVSRTKKGEEERFVITFCDMNPETKIRSHFMSTKDSDELTESELRDKLKELGLTKSEIEFQVSKAREQESV